MSRFRSKFSSNQSPSLVSLKTEYCHQDLSPQLFQYFSMGGTFIFCPFPSSFSSSGSLRVGKFPMLPGWLSGKESACQSRRHEFDPWVRKIPWRRKWQPTPIFLPGESRRQRSLAGFWGLQSMGSQRVISRPRDI